MKLSTPINIPKPEFKFTYNTKLVGMGSCFAQYIMEYFKNLNFDISYNPNGIVYNSYSIKQSLKHICQNKIYSDNDFIEYNNLWHSWEHHGSFSSANKENFIENIKNIRIKFYDKLKNADIFILTPSSSVVYTLNHSNRIVANCHKYPGKNFHTEILSKNENYENIQKSIKYIRNINPGCLIIITLSPVRHYPGDLILNARSKANILSAIHENIEEYDNILYFPSYEILLDELRDYRFYNDDMLHPSDLARKIIFDEFINIYFDDQCKNEIKKAEKIYKASKHRILN
ncbi:MAG: GSCFA domain-containing protein [bacterium]|nr:GSCFA domain-containing protein [bacterium]